MSIDSQQSPAAGPGRITAPILLVGNPTSRSGRAAGRIDRVKTLLAELGIPFVFHSTLPAGRTVSMVTDLIVREGFHTVVYMGGDGTFYEVAKGICMTPHPRTVRLGMLPSGTANDQGKSFGISSLEKDLQDNIDTIIEGHTQGLDVGQVSVLGDDGTLLHQDLFFDSLGWGLSAAILAFRNRELKLVSKMPIVRDMYRDHMVYVRAAVHELAMNWLTRDRFTAEIDIDGDVQTLPNLSDLVISNTMIYAGEWVIDPQSAANDGLFEVAPFSGFRDWTSKLIVHHKKNPLTVEMLQRIGLHHTPNRKGKSLRIQMLRPERDKRLPSQRDGEEFIQADHFQVNVLPGLLNVIVPKNFHWI